MRHSERQTLYVQCIILGMEDFFEKKTRSTYRDEVRNLERKRNESRDYKYEVTHKHPHIGERQWIRIAKVSRRAAAEDEPLYPSGWSRSGQILVNRCNMKPAACRWRCGRGRRPSGPSANEGWTGRGEGPNRRVIRDERTDGWTDE